MKSSEQIAIIYHSLFDYRLSGDNRIRWKAGKRLILKSNNVKLPILSVKTKKEREEFMLINRHKKALAVSAAKVLSIIPTILFVGITGSLAMENAKKASDIDVMIITKANTLWITRIFAPIVLLLFGFKIRRAFMKDEEDRICMNVWIDETSLDLPGMPHNAYTAHEIAQVVPLTNKKKQFEKWLSLHRWVIDYWPFALSAKPVKANTQTSIVVTTLAVPLNIFAYWVQVFYMRRKVTRETFSPHYAYFHPFDWGEVVERKLRKMGVLSPAN